MDGEELEREEVSQMKAPITFAIAGFGDRGSTYASMEKLFPDKMKVVAVADLLPQKVEKARALYHSLGFGETGNTLDGEIQMELILE